MAFNDVRIKSCCYECKERFPACHDVCATYLQAKVEQEEKKRIINENREKCRRLDYYHYQQVSKTKRFLANKKGK